jgi:hypothetical protein
MNKNINGLIAVAVIGLLGYLAFKKLGSKGGLGQQKNREVVKNYLISTYGYSKEREDFSKTADQDFIDLWAEAIMSGKDTFQHNNNTIVTATGRVKK